jgi:LysR family nitrogen assimilation transcriptional regulator
MEEHLCTSLLDRSRNGVAPTEAGRLLASRAHAILNDLSRTEDEVRTLGGDPAGEVRIGLPGTIGDLVALPLLETARREYPQITINVSEAMSGFVAGWLAEGRVDAAVLYSSRRESNLKSRLLLEEELVILHPPGEGGAAELTVAELQSRPLILPSKAHGLRQQADAVFHAAGIEPEIAIEIDSYSNIKRLVTAGFGASILPRHAVLQEVREGRLAESRFAAPGLWRGAYLVYPSGKPATRAQSAVRGLITRVVSELQAGGEWPGSRLPSGN